MQVALRRLKAGNTAALKSVGRGVHEVRIDFGPGYRVYVGMDGDELVILLGGSAKARQSAAIAAAQELLEGLPCAEAPSWLRSRRAG